jgi:hypothetical protein
MSDDLYARDFDAMFFSDRKPELVSKSRNYLIAYDLRDAANALSNSENQLDEIMNAKILLTSEMAHIKEAVLAEQRVLENYGLFVDSVFATDNAIANQNHAYRYFLDTLTRLAAKTKASGVSRLI